MEKRDLPSLGVQVLCDLCVCVCVCGSPDQPGLDKVRFSQAQQFGYAAMASAFGTFQSNAFSCFACLLARSLWPFKLAASLGLA